MNTVENTATGDGGPVATEGGSASLAISFQAEHPVDPGACELLDDSVREVRVGRGAERSSVRSTSGHGVSLALRLVDARMSSTHARFERRANAWFVLDEGSKNGSRVNGEEIERAQLSDGDIIELGSTFFIFREGVRSISTVDAQEEPALGIATLNASFDASLRRLQRVASSMVSIILRGASGTGKEVTARAVHSASGRAGPLVAINCGALPQTLVETELFGSKKGAFSGSISDREGLVRSAQGGTLLLDEIGDLPLPSQAALLRVLQEREVLPVGGTRAVPIDVRFIAATHRDLSALVASGSFREDLLARLAGFELEVPSLWDRREDLGVLIRSLLLRLAPSRAGSIVFTRRAARALFAYEWPRNVRELEKCLETALALAGEAPIDLDHLPSAIVESEPARPLSAGDANAPNDRSCALHVASPEDEQRRARLIELLRTHRGNLSAVARELGKARFQVQRWVKRYALRAEDYR